MLVESALQGPHLSHLFVMMGTLEKLLLRIMYLLDTTLNLLMITAVDTDTYLKFRAYLLCTSCAQLWAITRCSSEISGRLLGLC